MQVGNNIQHSERIIVLTTKSQAALQSLCRKEMMERTEDGFRLAVPLFGLWILKNQVTEELSFLRPLNQ